MYYVCIRFCEFLGVSMYACIFMYIKVKGPFRWQTIEVTILLAGDNKGEGEGGSVEGQGCRSTVVSSGGGCAGRGSTKDVNIVRTSERSSVKAKETV